MAGCVGVLHEAPIDAGASDSGTEDAGTSDAGASDAGSRDAGSGDAGSSDAGALSALPPMPVISRGAPAYASSGTAGLANDSSYDTIWRSNETTSAAAPSWLAYDLSGVPAAHRGRVDVAWYNGNGGYDEYDLFAKADAGAVAYNDPRDYTLEGNGAPGGTLPDAGWVVLLTMAGNTYISREHVLDLTGYNWLRMNVTAINGTTFNLNTAVNLDVHDASLGAEDSWLFLGDSITAFTYRNDGASIGAPSFAELVNSSAPAYFPAAQGAGEGGWTSYTALSLASPDGGGTLFDAWLETFPGHYVALLYGTNDGANGSGDATPTYNNFVTMVNKVLAAGKIPCIPHVPWAQDTGHQLNAQLINAKLDQLYAQYPKVIPGPDLYTVMLNQNQYFQDSLHPNPQGRAAYRQAWANAMVGRVYP